MRSDGRSATDLRPVALERGANPYAEGSCLVRFGGTLVHCTASVESGVPPFRKGTGQGWVTAEYAMLPRATSERTARERHGPGGRSQEIQRLIGRSLRAAMGTMAFGEHTIRIDCDVLQADGGTRTAAITGAFTALYIFFKRQQKARKIFTFPVTGHIAAVSCGIVEGEALLDLDYEEDYMATCDMNVVGDGDNFAEVQSSGEEKLFTRAQLDKLTGMASAAIKDIIAMQKEAIKSAM